MSQHDGVIDDASGAVFRADLNAALQALLSGNSGTSAPSTTYANMEWTDTTNHVVKRRNEANSAWIVRARTDAEGMVDKSSGFTVGLRDHGKVFRCTSALTVALAAAATLADGFWCGIVNASSGAVVIDPDSSEQVDGAATKSLPAGFSCYVFGNGTLFRTIGVAPDMVGDAGSGGSKGLVPAPGSGDAAALKYLAADGTWKAVKGTLVQRVKATYATATSVTASTPFDDTIPQSGEGQELFTLAITPTKSTNRLLITVALCVTGGNGVCIHLHQDSDADAIAAVTGAANINNHSQPSMLFHEMAAGTTSATTFKVRIGVPSSTAYVNGNNAGRLFGGKMVSYILIEEYVP